MTDLTPYHAYELVDLEGRTVLTAPAPGLVVYLASEVETICERLARVTELEAQLHEWEITVPHSTIIGLNAEVRGLKAELATVTWERDKLKHFHRPDCAAILDDEGDHVLADYQTCTCRMSFDEDRRFILKLKARLATCEAALQRQKEAP